MSDNRIWNEWEVVAGSISVEPNLEESERLLAETPSYAAQNVKEMAKAWDASINLAKHKNLQVFYRSGHGEISFEEGDFAKSEDREETIVPSGQRGSFSVVGRLTWVEKIDDELDYDDAGVTVDGMTFLISPPSGVFRTGDWVEFSVSRLTVWA